MYNVLNDTKKKCNSISFILQQPLYTTHHQTLHITQKSQDMQAKVKPYSEKD